MAPLAMTDSWIAKETALEAYRDATRPYGFKHRPTFGERGSGVVSATMSYWHGVDFSTMAKTERDATLRAATYWEKDRRGWPGPRVRVDREAHGRLCGVLRAVLAEELGPPPGTRVAVLWDDDVVYEGVVDKILGRARARIRFDNDDSWDATFPDATVTVISPASRDAAASAATPAAAALALGRPDFGAVRAREAAAKSANKRKRVASAPGAPPRAGTYKERAIARVRELVPATPVALLPPRSASEKETKPAAPGWLSGKDATNELELSRVLPREHAIAEARLSERRGVLAASELGEAATLARNFVQNDALQAEPTGEAFFDRVLPLLNP